MLVAVEASADRLGAGLIRALRTRLGAGVTFVGVGGDRMAAEGVASPVDIAGLSLVGLFEIAGAVPRALRDIEATIRLAEREQPDVAVLIDSWEFTWRIARRLKLRVPGALRVKYVAPQVWATRPGRARTAARYFDAMLTLFDFETRYFEAAGLPATCVGNPALRRMGSVGDSGGLRARIGASDDDPILLILPGSRPGEIKRVLPPFEDAAMRLSDVRPTLRLVVGAAETVADAVKARVAGWRIRADVIEGDEARYEAMRGATLALACSGTVTTELAAAGCPMVVAYRAHPATAMVARAVLKTRFFTLFNIAADAEIAPEFLQQHCNGPELAAAASALLDDPARRASQAAAQTAALASLGLGGPDPFEAAAEAVIALARANGRLA
jgi:lipid-A-disaccharide synthase